MLSPSQVSPELVLNHVEVEEPSLCVPLPWIRPYPVGLCNEPSPCLLDPRHAACELPCLEPIWFLLRDLFLKSGVAFHTLQLRSMQPGVAHRVPPGVERFALGPLSPEHRVPQPRYCFYVAPLSV